MDSKSLDRGVMLHYLNTPVHMVQKGVMFCSGDIVKRNGEGGLSIYGRRFADEPYVYAHAYSGLLSLQHRGKNMNNSQFAITLKALPERDMNFSVFGRVVAGHDVLRKVCCPSLLQRSYSSLSPLHCKAPPYHALIHIRRRWRTWT